MSSLTTLMSEPAVTAAPSEPLTSLVARMHAHHVGSVVVTVDGRPVGIVTERDVLRCAAAAAPGASLTTDLAVDVMSSPVDAVTVRDEPRAVLGLMRERGYRHVPVLDEAGHVQGVVSLRDLARVAEVGPPDVPRGLKGVVVADTEVGDVRGAEGFYHYRQHSAIDLARERPLEDVWRLLVDGALPSTAAERDAFRDEVAPLAALPGVLRPLLPAIAGSSVPLDGLRSALSIVAAAEGMRPTIDLDPAGRRADALRLAAVTPTILAALWRLRTGHQPVAPDPGLGWAANYVTMLTGTTPPPAHVRAIEQYLVTTVDHGFNASTFTARVVTSTGADVGAAIVAAIGALGGPLHGGAPSRALALLDEIREAGGDERAIDAVIRPRIVAGERIMGFGHAVYRTDDPRSLLLRDVARLLGGPVVDLALATERRVVELLEELKPGRELRTNVEFYAGVVMDACGIPRDMFTPTFASSRVIGWSANVLEQAAANKIIRPSARYVGPPPPQPVPPLTDSGT